MQFSIAPSGKSRPRRSVDRVARRRLRWVVVLGVLSINCVALERRPSVVVEGDVMYGAVEYQEQGCEGSTYREAHRQVGGSVAVRYEGKDGPLASARVRAVADSVVEASPDDVREGAVDPLVSVGAFVGHDRAQFGGDVGLTVLGTPGAAALYVPSLRLRAGDLAAMWGELSLGSDDPLLALTVVSAGAAMRHGGFRGRAGVASTARLMAFSGDGGREPTMVALADYEGYSVFAYLEAEYRGERGPGLVLGGVLGPYPAVRAGFTWTFGAE